MIGNILWEYLSICTHTLLLLFWWWWFIFSLLCVCSLSLYISLFISTVSLNDCHGSARGSSLSASCSVSVSSTGHTRTRSLTLSTFHCFVGHIEPPSYPHIMNVCVIHMIALPTCYCFKKNGKQQQHQHQLPNQLYIKVRDSKAEVQEVQCK
jgi:hypothetical protein